MLPELPEVETVKRTLETRIVGKTIKSVQVLLPKIILPLQVEEFRSIVKDSEIVELGRRGKYLLVYLSSSFTLIISLRMTGRLVFASSEQGLSLDKHTHLIFEFNDGSYLYFNDIRKFGTVHCTPSKDVEQCPEISKLGPDPMGEGFSEEHLQKKLAGKRKTIKQVLLDQTFIAGIGNIYADEVLFHAGIHPELPANLLSPDKVHRLFLAVNDVLREAVAQRGTTFRDYVDGTGNTGNYQDFLKVYGRKGKKCYHCGQEIKTMRLGGRTAHFCPSCQREGN